MNEFEWAMQTYRHGLVNKPTVNRREWQAKLGDDGSDPRFLVREILNVQFSFQMPPTNRELQEMIRPNLPWAEDHFQERVGGEPLNPGKEYRNWPWYEQGVEEHKPNGQFSHTYMERFWPKRAGYVWERWGRFSEGIVAPRAGIRFDYGDLQDVVELLMVRPMTRQAFLPIWFPEDTGAHHGQRVPCTLGYHFQFDAEMTLHCTYFARSIDFVRYLRDDAYMAARLTEWIQYTVDPMAQLGMLTMCIANLHCFEGDVPKLLGEIADEEDEYRGV